MTFQLHRPENSKWKTRCGFAHLVAQDLWVDVWMYETVSHDSVAFKDGGLNLPPGIKNIT